MAVSFAVFLNPSIVLWSGRSGDVTIILFVLSAYPLQRTFPPFQGERAKAANRG